MCDSLVSAEEAIECEEIVQDTSFQALQISELKKRNKVLESKNCELSELVMLEVTEKEGIADAAEEVEKLYLERVQQQEAGEEMVASLRAELSSLKESSSAQEEKMSQDRATILQLTADSSSLRAKVQLLDDMMRDACNIRDEGTATPSTFVTEGDAIDETRSVPDMLESEDCSGDEESEEGDGDREGEDRKEEYDFGDDESNFSGRETAEDKQQYRLTQALGIKSAKSVSNKPAVRRPRTLAVKERRAFRGGEAVKSTRDTYSPSFSTSPMEISPVQTQRFSRNSISPLGGPHVRGSREGSPLTTCSSIDNRRRSAGSTSSRGHSPVSSKMDSNSNSNGGVSATASVTASAASSGSIVGISIDRATNSGDGNSNSSTSKRLAGDHQAARQRTAESLFSPSGITMCMSDGSPGQYQFRTELYTASQTLKEHSREDRAQEEEEGDGEAGDESEGLAEKTLEATNQSDVLHAVKGELVNESVFDDIPIPDMVSGPHVVHCPAPATFVLAEMTPLECRSMSLDSGIFAVSNGDVSLPLLHVDADEKEEEVSLFEAMRERESSLPKPRGHGRGQSERSGRPDQVEEIKALLSQHLRRFEAISEDFRKTALSSLEHQRTAQAIAPFSVEKEEEIAMEKHLLGEGPSDFLIAADAQEIALSDAAMSPTLGPAVRHRPLPDGLNGAKESMGSGVTTGVDSRYEDRGFRMDSSEQQLHQQVKQQQQQQHYEQRQQMQHQQQQRQQQQPRSYSPRDPRPSSSPPRASNGSHFQNLKKQLAMQLESSSRTEQAAPRSSGALSYSSTHPFAQTSPRYSHCEEKDNTLPDCARAHHRKRTDEVSTKRSLVLDLNSVRDELRGRSALSPNHTALQSNERGRGHGGDSLTLSLSKTPREGGDRFVTPSMGESSFGPGTARPKPDGDVLSEYQEYRLEMEYEKYLLHFRREQERVTKQIRVQREFFKSVNPPHTSSSSSAYPSSFSSNVSTRSFSSPKSNVRGGDRELVETLRVAKVALDLSQSDMHLTHQKMLELTMKVDLLQQENRNLKHLSRPPARGPGPGLDPSSSSYGYSATKVNYRGHTG
jgi:hypothetical protein